MVCKVVSLYPQGDKGTIIIKDIIIPTVDLTEDPEIEVIKEVPGDIVMNIRVPHNWQRAIKLPYTIVEKIEDVPEGEICGFIIPDDPLVQVDPLLGPYTEYVQLPEVQDTYFNSEELKINIIYPKFCWHKLPRPVHKDPRPRNWTYFRFPRTDPEVAVDLWGHSRSFIWPVLDSYELPIIEKLNSEFDSWARWWSKPLPNQVEAVEIPDQWMYLNRLQEEFLRDICLLDYFKYELTGKLITDLQTMRKEITPMDITEDWYIRREKCTGRTGRTFQSSGYVAPGSLPTSNPPLHFGLPAPR
jgi:hypothetical protein